MSSFAAVRAVVFDYYFTLADPVPPRDRTIDAMLGRLFPSMTRVEFDQRRAEYNARHPSDVPSPIYDGPAPAFRSFRDRWTEYGDALFASLGVNDAGTHWADARAAAHATAPLYPGTHAVLAELRSRGLRLGVASDADRDFLDANQARHALEFDAVVASDDIGCYKPHRSMFDAICDALSLQPAESVYVGDGPETDVEGARRSGLRAVWIERGHVTWPATLDAPPHTIHSLDQLPRLLNRPGPPASS
ncbi:MAG: HAD family hydrolase [Acidimicrobiia bacterium]